MFKRMENLLILGAVLLCLLGASEVQLQAATWDGGAAGNQDWNDPLNWVGDTLPVSGEALIFTNVVGTGGTTLNNNLTVSDAWEIDKITYNSGAAAFTVTGDPFKLDGSNGILNNSGSLQVINNSFTLDDNNSKVKGNSDVTLGGAILGAASHGLDYEGTATLLLTGTGSTYGRKASIQSAGTLKAGAVNTFPSTIALVLGKNGTIDLNGFDQTIDGSSQLAQRSIQLSVNTTAETSTLDLNGANLFLTGGASNLSQIGSDSNAFGNHAIIDTAGGGSLHLGSFTRNVSIGVSGNKAKTLTISTDITSSGGGINYSGNNTSLVLSGTNSYTGGMTVNNGATLFFATAGAKPGTGTTTVLSGGTYGLLAPTAAKVTDLFANSGSGEANNVNMQSGSLVGIDTTAGDFTMASGIAASNKGLSKLGSGTATLTGNNAYTGQTLVREGILQLDGDNSALTGTSKVFVGATLRATADDSLPTGTMTLENGTLELRSDANLTMSAPSNIQLANPGNGTIVVGPAVGSGATNGDHFLPSTVTVNASKVLTVNGVNGYALTLGTYQNGDNNNNGLVANTDVTINNFKPRKTLSGASGGGLVANGAGVTIDVGTTTPLGNGNLKVSGAGTVNFNGSISGSFGSGFNRFTIAAADVRFLGANSFTGGMQITSSGVLTIGDGATSGTGSAGSDITLQGTLKFNRSDTLTQGTDFGNLIGNNNGGKVEQNGTGTTVFTLANDYNGSTTINAGTLLINGNNSASTGAVIVNSSGTLGGTGMVGGAIDLNASGAVAPGASIGTLNGTSLTWDSDDLLAGMVFELSSVDNTSDLLDLSGSLAKGSGSSFLFDFTGGLAGQTYTLVQFGSTDFVATDFGIASGIDGTFDIVGNSLQFTATATNIVPEPQSILLAACGLLGLIGLTALRRRQK